MALFLLFSSLDTPPHTLFAVYSGLSKEVLYFRSQSATIAVANSFIYTTASRFCQHHFYLPGHFLDISLIFSYLLPISHF